MRFSRLRLYRITLSVTAWYHGKYDHKPGAYRRCIAGFALQRGARRHDRSVPMAQLVRMPFHMHGRAAHSQRDSLQRTSTQRETGTHRHSSPALASATAAGPQFRCNAVEACMCQNHGWQRGHAMITDEPGLNNSDTGIRLPSKSTANSTRWALPRRPHACDPGPRTTCVCCVPHGRCRYETLGSCGIQGQPPIRRNGPSGPPHCSVHA